MEICMYEPTHLPIFREKNALLTGVSFSLLYNNSFVRHDDPDIEPAHIHEYTELFFNISSEVSFLVNNKIFPIAHGNAVLVGANDIHVCIYEKSCNQEYFCLWIDSVAESPISTLLKEAKGDGLLCFDSKTSESLRLLLFSLWDIYEVEGMDTERASLFLQIVTLLSKRNAISPMDANVPEQFQRILDDINENFASLHYVSDIISNHFVSSATLDRWFRRYLHITPREFLESKKLSHAANLLAAGESVTDACLRSGFSDCSHFIRLFKKKFGETPLKYKQRSTNNG